MGRWYVTVQSNHQGNRRRSRGQGRFTCGTCDRRYHQEKNLRRHLTNECGKQPKHQCTFCPYKATYKSYLHVHMMKHRKRGFVPPDTKYPMARLKHTCKTCGKSYKHKHHLKRHHDFECGIEPKFPCDFCDHRTRYKDSLTKHVLARHQHLLEQNTTQYGGGSGGYLHRQTSYDSNANKSRILKRRRTTTPITTKERTSDNSSNWMLSTLPSTTPFAMHTKCLRSMTSTPYLTEPKEQYGTRKYICQNCQRKFTYRASFLKHQKFKCDSNKQEKLTVIKQENPSVTEQEELSVRKYKKSKLVNPKNLTTTDATATLHSDIVGKKENKSRKRKRVRKTTPVTTTTERTSDNSSNWMLSILPSTTRLAMHTKCLRSMTSTPYLTEPKEQYGTHKYICQNCKRKFALRAYLLRHQKFECNSNKQEKRTVTKQEKLSVRKYKKSKLVNPKNLTTTDATATLHSDIEGKKERNHICLNCNKSYVYGTSLRRHIRFECGKEPQFLCHVCKTTFSQKGNLRRHIRVMH
ncbi:PREDICTED: zinc finger protein 585B-like [Polistes dominula]|uniref:Zinc finger protein 585B-like n=1 Tax=Polistes dominula TaxID=743375 RepID=A0ABM1IEF4_POLDO|nr:PREDICTED: zinc finger protein 585B-like [Polistes dominula]